MAVNAHLRYVFCFSVAAVLSYAQISDLRLCSDRDCNAQISEARTLIRYHSTDPRILSFQINTAVKIFSKSAGSNPDLWGAEISGKRGYVPKKFIREQKVFIPKSDLKAIVPTEDSISPDKFNVESSSVKSVVTRGIETIATFPASLDRILSRVFASAEPLNIESVSTDSIENVTLHDATIIEASKSDSPVVRTTESVDPKAESALNSAETSSACTYSFGSVLARFVTSRMDINPDQEMDDDDDDDLDMAETFMSENEHRKRSDDFIETATNSYDDADDDDDDYMLDEDEMVGSSQYEFVQLEATKTETGNEEKEVLTSSFTPEEESIGSEFTEKVWKVTEKQMISGSVDDEIVENDVSTAAEDVLNGETFETPLQTLVPTSEADKTTSSASINVENEDEPAISTSINEENDEKETILTSINDENEEQTISTSINEENEEKQSISTSISVEIDEKQSISTPNDEETVEKDVLTAPEDPTSEESPLRILVPTTKSEKRTISSSLNEQAAETKVLSASDDSIFGLPFVGDDFELGKQIQFLIDFLPESVQVVLSDQNKMGVSSHATVLTSITGFFLVLLFTIYFLIKRGNKEHVLVARLCNLDRKLFVVTAERDLLREKAEIAVEHEEKYAQMDETFSVVGEDLASAREENCALCSRVEKLEEEVGEYKNVSVRLTAEGETKDRLLRQLEEEQEVLEENARCLEEQVGELNEELRDKTSTISDSERRIFSLTEETEELKESNGQLLSEAQVWNQRLLESQEQIELMSKTNDDLLKEIEILRDTATQLEIFEAETDSETKSKKLEMLFDVSAMSAQLKATALNYAALQEEYDNKMNTCTLVETRLDELVAENELLRQRDAELKRERDEAVTKLHVLSDYFKGKEIELQKELGMQEAIRLQTEESALSVTEKAELYEKEVELHRAHIQALKKEMDNQLRSYKSQITVHESKSHENWLAARAAERRAEEAKQEAAMLRNKLTTLELEAANRSEMPETRLTPTRRDGDSNGQVNSPPPLLGHRIPFLPHDRPLPPPPPPRGGIPQHPPFLGDRLPRYDLPPPMMPFDFLPPPPGRRPPSPPMFNRRPPFGGPGPGHGSFRDLSPPRFYDRPNMPHKLPSDAQLSGPNRFPSPYSGSRGPGSPPSDANTSV